MYNKFYGFNEYPFKLTPDPDFFYLSPVHKKAISFLTYGLETKQGFIQLTGEIGSGKTTVLRSLIKSLHKEAKIAYIVNPKLTFSQLLRTILSQFEIVKPTSTLPKDRLLEKFHQYLIKQAKQNCPVVILFDEAQDIEPPELEEIRLLSNLEDEKEKLLQIVFVGQTELKDLFDVPELRQLKQRISVGVHIEPLSEEETGNYINHRLKVAGADSSIVFKKKAVKEIYKYSEGIPRLINIACDATLLAGYVRDKKVLDAAIAKGVIAELTTGESSEEMEEEPSTENGTSTTSKASIKQALIPPRWKVAIAASLLAAAAIAASVTLTPLPQFIRQKIEYMTSVITNSDLTAPEQEPENQSISKKE